MKKLMCLTMMLFLVGILSAQTLYHVSPVANTNKVGGTNNTFPFYNTQFVYMQIHADMLPRPMLITELAFRGLNSYPKPGFSPTVDLWLSTGKNLPTAASGTYANNHGTDKTQVATALKCNFPATTAGPSPRPFTHKIPFSKPFIYKGKMLGPLTWEVRVTSTTSTSSTPLDAAKNTATSLGMTNLKLGTGGMATGQTRNASNLPQVKTTPVGLNIYADQSNTGMKETPFMIVGYNDKQWGPIRLPFDLAPMGGKGNKLYTNILLFLVGKGTTDSFGNYKWESEGLGVPMDPNLLGMPFIFQNGSTDLVNKAFPFVFTHGSKITITTFPAAVALCRIYSYQSSTATSGSVGKDYGLITRFEYK